MDEHCDTCRCHSKRIGKLLDWMDALTFYRNGNIPSWTPMAGDEIGIIVKDYRQRLGREAYLELVPKADWPEVADG